MDVDIVTKKRLEELDTERRERIRRKFPCPEGYVEIELGSLVEGQEIVDRISRRKRKFLRMYPSHWEWFAEIKYLDADIVVIESLVWYVVQK